jgi:hypothetical protein
MNFVTPWWGVKYGVPLGVFTKRYTSHDYDIPGNFTDIMSNRIQGYFCMRI